MKNGFLLAEKQRPLAFAIVGALLITLSPGSAAPPPATVKGMIVVHDGRTIRENAPAYEFTSIKTGSGAFSARLANGRSVSGIEGHIIARIDYTSGDPETTLQAAAEIAREFPKSRPFLEIRSQQIRERTNARGDRVREEDPASSGGSAGGAAAAEVLADSGNPRTNPAAVETGSDSRSGAIAQLAFSATKEDLPKLEEHLSDEDPEIRRWAARGIGRVRSIEALEILIRSKDSTDDPGTKVELVKQLGRFGRIADPNIARPAITELITILKSPSSDTRLKSRADEELFLCMETHGPWIRGQIHQSDPAFAGLFERIGAIERSRSEAEAARKALELPEKDNRILLAYVNGNKEAEPGTPSARGRLAIATEQLQQVEKEIRRARASGKRNISDYELRFFRWEVHMLRSGIPLKIAVAAYHRYLIGVRQYKRTFGSTEELAKLAQFALDHAGAEPTEHLVDHGHHVQQVTDYSESVAGITAGVGVLLVQAAKEPYLKEFALLEGLFNQLSPQTVQLMIKHQGILQKKLDAGGKLEAPP